MTFKILLQFVCIFGVVFSQDVRKAFFELDNNVPGFSLSSSVLQDRDTFECTKNDNCQFIIKDDGSGKQSPSKWYKNKIALPENIQALGTEDCSSLKLKGVTKSGVYPMLINGKLEQIPCDMTTDGGGWTVFQRRVDGAVNFYRNWSSYKLGFGDRRGSFWLGLDLMHFMVSKWKSELRVDLTTFNRKILRYAKYGYVYIADESQAYNWTVLNYSGTAGDALTYHNNMKFSTYDNDNDVDSSKHCAVEYKGAFWFTNCLRANPNGLYFSLERPADNTVVFWRGIRFAKLTLNFIEMKFRRSVTGK